MSLGLNATCLAPHRLGALARVPRILLFSLLGEEDHDHVVCFEWESGNGLYRIIDLHFREKMFECATPENWMSPSHISTSFNPLHTSEERCLHVPRHTMHTHACVSLDIQDLYQAGTHIDTLQECRERREHRLGDQKHALESTHSYVFAE